jgi:photoactive yellow protein
MFRMEVLKPMNNPMNNREASNVAEALPESVDDEALPARVARLSREELDTLPFGVVQLDAEGKVVFFSHTEAEQSGYGDRRAIGRDFFTQMAPCMATPDRLRRIDDARRAGTLDIIFEQVGDFGDAERELRVRVVSASNAGLWLFIQRL